MTRTSGRKLLALAAPLAGVLGWSGAAAAQPGDPAPEGPPPVVAEPEAPPPSAAPAPPPPVATVTVGEPPRGDAPTPAEGEGAPRFDLVRVNAGFSVAYVGDRGFDAFAADDVLARFSVDGTYPLLTRGRAVLAAGLAYDYGGRESPMRSATGDLDVHRVGVPIEGRYHLAPWLFAFAKATPAAALLEASVTDAGGTLRATSWAFAVDGALGASILLGPRRRMDRRGPRFWITPELGYTFMTKASVAANVGREAEQVLGNDEDVSLRSLALNGFFWRATIGVTF